MPDAELVQIFLEDELAEAARVRRHNFLNLLTEVLEQAGFHSQICTPSDSVNPMARTLTHVKPPIGKPGLTFRRVYHYPFWQIEQTDRRWAWDVARARFDPSSVDTDEALAFQSAWRKRLFPDLAPQQGDAIYVPLQGCLQHHRSFQICSPIDMVAKVVAATDRPVVLGLHPKETYSETDLTLLRQIAPNATLQTGGMAEILPHCHAVVTQNSSAAFNGFFFDKPAVLFAQIDFHHIGQQKTPAGLADVLEMPEPRAYAQYVHWFWQQMSINAGRPDAKSQIRARLARFGWL